MLTITYTDLATNVQHTENFANYETYEMLDEMLESGAFINEWAHYNQQGQRTGGGKGINAEVSLRACHYHTDQEVIDDIAFQMSCNVD